VTTSDGDIYAVDSGGETNPRLARGCPTGPGCRALGAVRHYRAVREHCEDVVDLLLLGLGVQN